MNLKICPSWCRAVCPNVTIVTAFILERFSYSSQPTSGKPPQTLQEVSIGHLPKPHSFVSHGFVIQVVLLDFLCGRFEFAYFAYLCCCKRVEYGTLDPHQRAGAAVRLGNRGQHNRNSEVKGKFTYKWLQFA